jgi:hypothetical protein
MTINTETPIAWTPDFGRGFIDRIWQKNTSLDTLDPFIPSRGNHNPSTHMPDHLALSAIRALSEPEVLRKIEDIIFAYASRVAMQAVRENYTT